MPIVKGYDHDVFVSYAVDDRPAKCGWVSAFVSGLTRVIGRRRLSTISTGLREFC